MDKTNYMQLAIKLANKAAKNGDIPVGAVIVCNGKIVGQGYNKKEKNKNALLHAEIIAINQASKKLKDYRLENCELYVTFEPCLMCVGAILSARIKKVYFGAFDNRFGACKLLSENNFNHVAEYEGGVLEAECSSLLTSFFKNLRKNKEQKRKNNNN